MATVRSKAFLCKLLGWCPARGHTREYRHWEGLYEGWAAPSLCRFRLDFDGFPGVRRMSRCHSLLRPTRSPRGDGEELPVRPEPVDMIEAFTDETSLAPPWVRSLQGSLDLIHRKQDELCSQVRSRVKWLEDDHARRVAVQAAPSMGMRLDELELKMRKLEAHLWCDTVPVTTHRVTPACATQAIKSVVMTGRGLVETSVGLGMDLVMLLRRVAQRLRFGDSPAASKTAGAVRDIEGSVKCLCKGGLERLFLTSGRHTCARRLLKSR